MTHRDSVNLIPFYHLKTNLVVLVDLVVLVVLGVLGVLGVLVVLVVLGVLVWNVFGSEPFEFLKQSIFAWYVKNSPYHEVFEDFNLIKFFLVLFKNI